VQKLQKLGELECYFTTDYITEMMDCQVTVLIMYDKLAPSSMREKADGRRGGRPSGLLPRTDPEGSGLPLNGQSHPLGRRLAACERAAVGWLRLKGPGGARRDPWAWY